MRGGITMDPSLPMASVPRQLGPLRGCDTAIWARHCWVMGQIEHSAFGCDLGRSVADDPCRGWRPTRAKVLV